GLPFVILAGVHVGCYQLFGTNGVRTVRDLKGRTVAVPALRSGPHLILSIIARNIGLDPAKDINWVEHSGQESIALLAAGKVHAFLGFPPEPQEPQAKKIGQLVLNTATDKPWSQYFCCVVSAHREFARKYPVATKRAVRAILKATDICAREPALAAKFLVDKGYAPRYDYAQQALQDVNYTKWRGENPAGTPRVPAPPRPRAGGIKTRAPKRTPPPPTPRAPTTPHRKRRANRA